MLEMAAARCSPRARADGSLKRAGSPEPCAGEGVVGTAGALVFDETGAGGGAGVAADAGAGVEGTAAAGAGLGAAFGCEAFVREEARTVSTLILRMFLPSASYRR